jgi:Uma2 family endonuclease
MSATAIRTRDVTVEEYLAAEAQATVKHDYVDGAVYAMAGASEAHNTIAMNLYRMLGGQLRGKACQPFGSDMKVWVRSEPGQCFYYPDAMAACDPADSGHGWRERPAALFEIISDETRRVDEIEKRLVYWRIPSLRAYVRLEQDRPAAIVDRRISDADPGGWRTESLEGLDAILRLPDLSLELPLDELYERVRFPA